MPDTKSAFSKWREANQENDRLRCRLYYELNRDAVKAKALTRYHKAKAGGRRLGGKTCSKEQRRANQKLRLATDFQFRIRRVVSARIFKALKRCDGTKPSTTLAVLGCSVDFLKSWLESKFREGMNWENYGVKGWHIDHVKPCAQFDLTIEAEVRQCFHYTNLQPLWYLENIRKSCH